MGMEDWSPFSDIINPGDTVVIKPNLVINTTDPSMQECTTTHPSVIRPVIDYCWKALKGAGLIIVGDASGAEADFDIIISRTRIKETIDILKIRGINVRLEDFRAVKVTTENGVWTGEQRTVHSVASSQIVDLGEESQFYTSRSRAVKLHGAGYDICATTQYHSGRVQKYRVSKIILNADVVISLPKLKTHRKAGVTCCLKNLVGINTDKNYLPHFSMGSLNMGGDEMPPIRSKNVWRMKLYNFIRERIIAHCWKIIGRPAVLLLRYAKSIGKPKGKPGREKNVPRGERINRDIDLAKWFHNLLSGQRIAAGAWAGNETICRMILDLNKIFLCCDRQGILGKHTDRKVFYIVDAIVAGMGNGPTHPVPVCTKMIAAGWNGLKIDVALLNLLGIDEDSITLYRLAKEKEWMYANSEGECMYNSRSINGSDRVPVEFIPPDGWIYHRK
jgi:uncharacterized protein (DUF362 family)